MIKKLLLILILISFSGCEKNNIQFFNKEKPVVVIGDEKFYKKDIVEFIYFEIPDIDPNTMKDKDFKKEILNNFIKHKLLVMEAKKAKINIDKKLVKNLYKKLNNSDKSEELNADSEKMIEERLLAQKYLNDKLREYLKITDEELKLYYQEFIKNREGKTYYHLYQIVNEDKSKVEEAYKKLKSGEEFEDVAKLLSSGPEAENGGNMGIIDLENFPPVFDNIKKMKKGEISKIIPSEYGYHIFFLKDIVASENPPFEEVKDILYNELIEAKKDQFLEEFLKEIMKNVKIEINPDFNFIIDNSTSSKN